MTHHLYELARGRIREQRTNSTVGTLKGEANLSKTRGGELGWLKRCVGTFAEKKEGEVGGMIFEGVATRIRKKMGANSGAFRNDTRKKMKRKEKRT